MVTFCSCDRSLEEQFYIVFPTLFLLVTRVSKVSANTIRHWARCRDRRLLLALYHPDSTWPEMDLFWVQVSLDRNAGPSAAT
jgi:peptidoglycan/LPS O-acetylase OafA/YrhL